MISDAMLEILSQTNAAVLVVIAAVIVFCIMKLASYRKQIKVYAENWRKNENEREARENLVLENQKEIQQLKVVHQQDMEKWERQQEERYNQSIAIRQELRQEVADTRQEMKDSMNQIIKSVNQIEMDALNREIDQIRYKIIRFSKELRYGDPKTTDEYNHIFQSIDKYKTLLERAHAENGQIEIESKYIREQYLKHLETNDFIG